MCLIKKIHFMGDNFVWSGNFKKETKIATFWNYSNNEDAPMKIVPVIFFVWKALKSQRSCCIDWMQHNNCFYKFFTTKSSLLHLTKVSFSVSGYDWSQRWSTTLWYLPCVSSRAWLDMGLILCDNIACSVGNIRLGL